MAGGTDDGTEPPEGTRPPGPDDAFDARTGPAFNAVIAAAQVGADWALAVLYRRFQPAVLRYLRGRAPGQEEDLASDVWLDAARGLAGFSGGEDAFGRWIFTIARRRTIDLARKRSRRKTDVSHPTTFTGLAGTDDPERSVVDRMAGDEAVARIVAILPKEQAEVVLLRVVAGLSVSDVAAIVGRSPAHVSVMQHRALRRLARTLAPADGEGPRK